MLQRQQTIATSPRSHPHPHPHHLQHQHQHQHQHQQHLAQQQAYHNPPPPQHVYAPQLAYQDSALLAAGYRPLQLLPLQKVQHSHNHASVAAEQQQRALLAQQQVQQAPGFLAPNSRLHHQHTPIPHRPRRAHTQQPQQPHSNMAYTASDDELAQLQKASNEWEPEVTGPLVGQRQPTTNITTEYAAADPVYQAKTAALPSKYSNYRTVRGDGRCGWRAVAFGFLERLLHIGDSGRFLQEEARLRSLANVLNAAGFEPYLYEDFADELFDLMRRLATALDEGRGDEALLDEFNDENVQNCVITHFRTLTAAWMKTHPENYAGYMVGQTVDQYCDINIMPMGAEIDHLGLSALKDVLLGPASIALEVMYLDRSEGDEVNFHRFDPSTGYTAATVRLLYRPGHYDILYKMEDVPPPPPPISTYLQFSSSSHHNPAQQLNQFGSGYSEMPDFLTTIPGMSFASPQSGWMQCSGYGSDFLTAPAPIQQCAQPLPAPMASVSQPQVQPHMPSHSAYIPVPPPSTLTGSAYMPSTPSTLSGSPPEHAHGLVIRNAPHAVIHAAVDQPTFSSSSNGVFRPSFYEFQPGFAQATSGGWYPETSIFKNSHFNTAHFMNPDFQPEEWKPDDDYAIPANKSRHKLSG